MDYDLPTPSFDQPAMSVPPTGPMAGTKQDDPTAMMRKFMLFRSMMGGGGMMGGGMSGGIGGGGGMTGGISSGLAPFLSAMTMKALGGFK